MTTTMYTRKERFPFRKLDEQTVIINAKSHEVHVLNGTGSIIWELLAQTRSIPDLVALVFIGYEGAADRVYDDVSAFISDLERKGLVTPVATEPQG